MILKDGVFQSEGLSNFPLVHGFTTRSCGNLGFGKNPGDPNVVLNRKKLFKTWNLSHRVHVQPSQQHTDRIVFAQNFQPGEVADASVAVSSQFLLSVLTADCVPVLVYNPAGYIAAIHCGWRGLKERIIEKALLEFQSGSCAAIGPAIGVCCYEVGEDLAQTFAHDFGEQVVRSREGEKPHLDLVQTALLQLQRSRVTDIEAAHLCTYCHPDLFFSYRRDGSSGRMMSFIALHEF